MPNLTPEAWAQIRHAYEHTDRPVEDICAEHGISSGTLRHRMRRWNWRRRRAAISREGPPAIAPDAFASPPPVHAANGGEGSGGVRAFRIADHPTPTVFAGAQTADPPPPGEGDGGADVPQPTSAASAGSDAAQIVPRLQSAVARVLPAIEATIAKLAAGPQRPREMEQTARALGVLTRTLRELNGLLSQREAVSPYASGYDDMPEDLDAFRDELARRINAFVASRSGEAFEDPPAEG